MSNGAYLMLCLMLIRSVRLRGGNIESKVELQAWMAHECQDCVPPPKKNNVVVDVMERSCIMKGLDCFFLISCD